MKGVLYVCVTAATAVLWSGCSLIDLGNRLDSSIVDEPAPTSAGGGQPAPLPQGGDARAPSEEVSSPISSNCEEAKSVTAQPWIIDLGTSNGTSSASYSADNESVTVHSDSCGISYVVVRGARSGMYPVPPIVGCLDSETALDKTETLILSIDPSGACMASTIIDQAAGSTNHGRIVTVSGSSEGLFIAGPIWEVLTINGQEEFKLLGLGSNDSPRGAFLLHLQPDGSTRLLETMRVVPTVGTDYGIGALAVKDNTIYSLLYAAGSLEHSEGSLRITEMPTDPGNATDPVAPQTPTQQLAIVATSLDDEPTDIQTIATHTLGSPAFGDLALHIAEDTLVAHFRCIGTASNYSLDLANASAANSDSDLTATGSRVWWRGINHTSAQVAKYDYEGHDAQLAGNPSGAFWLGFREHEQEGYIVNSDELADGDRIEWARLVLDSSSESPPNPSEQATNYQMQWRGLLGLDADQVLLSGSFKGPSMLYAESHHEFYTIPHPIGDLMPEPRERGFFVHINNDGSLIDSAIIASSGSVAFNAMARQQNSADDLRLLLSGRASGTLQLGALGPDIVFADGVAHDFAANVSWSELTANN